MMNSRTKNPIDRFYKHVQKTDGCHIWIGAKGGDIHHQYGKFRINNKTVSAHKFIWEQKRGLVPDGKFVCHKCDNCLCVRLSHLFVGSPLDNVRDMIAKGRKNPYRKLTDQDIEAIIHRIRDGYRIVDIAATFQVSRQTIHTVRNKYAYRDL